MRRAFKQVKTTINTITALLLPHSKGNTSSDKGQR